MATSSSSSSSDDDSQSDKQGSNIKESRPSKRQRSEDDGSDPSEAKPTSAPLEVALTSTISSSKQAQKPIIVLLDQATLETVKSNRGVYELLNCDDHRDICKRKLKKDPNQFRPDILHQEILALLDSPLNKAGLLKIYIQTQKRVLIDVHSSIRIPRTYKRFAGLMVQLLHKMKIKAGTESTTLLKVIKNPFSQYLPAGTSVHGMSCQGKLYSPMKLAQSLVPATPDEKLPPTCFIVGAMSTGHVTIEDHPYMQGMFSISEYPLSGAAALSRIAGGIEHHWGIV